jgi:hypothetical protein
VKLSWLLRGSTWRTFHLHRCLECGRSFTDDEPGSWTDIRSDEFPELCSCRDRTPRGTVSHVNCKACGPYCPGCATQVQEFWLKQREAYRD